MGVEIPGNLNPGSSSLLQFSDNFNRVNSSDLGRNWIRCLGGDGAGTCAYAQANILNNRCSINGQGNNNPTQVLDTAWLPIPVISSLYLQPSTFVQATYISNTATIAAGIMLRYNNAHEAGPITSPNGMDGYVCGIDGQTAQIINGNTIAGIGANTVPIVANNVLRLEVVNNGTISLLLTSKVNGVIVNQNTILAASFPIFVGSPGLALWAVGSPNVAAESVVFDDFSCGVL